ncbi:histidine kinase [Sphingomonas sp. Leaf17]|uniref:ATP-binding protein n=1 Tax=Sphingomonas sp. Leaf17 TaxID=1735683 RepID=UPI000701D2EC|nr:ATP-binding protein [Sphingomonas sp. Leaf17]KQM65617.1 histidine kinase [Sphingomonas sp. Leaf17]
MTWSALAGRLTRLRLEPISLGSKLVLILTVVGVVGAIGITILLAAVITPSFSKLESRAVAGHVARTRAALVDYAAKADGAARDYGDSNASHGYMTGAVSATNLDGISARALRNVGMQGVAYVDAGGRVVLSRWRDAAASGDDARHRAALATMAGAMDWRTTRRGFYARLGADIAAIGIAPIRRSDGSGGGVGHVLMARLLTSAQLSALLQLRAVVDPVPVATAGAVTTTRGAIGIGVPIVGADGRAVASARFTVGRDVSVLGRRMLMLAVAGSTVLLLLVLVVLRRVIDVLVLAPLHRVEHHMQRVRASGSLSALEEEGRRDEFGSLGRSFNAMLQQLKDLREQIEAQSFALGRTESAVAVMHNVRNALAPVSTILSQGVAQGAAIDRAMLDRALGELTREDVDGARRQKLTAFVGAAIETETTNRIAQQRELQIGREAMAHVLEIIGTQQARAHERPLLDPCDVSEVIARNASIARYTLGLSIGFRFPAEPHMVLCNRVILSQVIGNLIGNAAEAIAATGRQSGTITVTIEDHDGTTRIRFRDDGEGFDKASAAVLFQRGFSTRPQKSGGLGLHWCANSMTAMDGALTLDSDGVGQGATATLTLKSAPVQAMGRAA